MGILSCGVDIFLIFCGHHKMWYKKFGSSGQLLYHLFGLNSLYTCQIICKRNSIYLAMHPTSTTLCHAHWFLFPELNILNFKNVSISYTDQSNFIYSTYIGYIWPGYRDCSMRTCFLNTLSNFCNSTKSINWVLFFISLDYFIYLQKMHFLLCQFFSQLTHLLLLLHGAKEHSPNEIK